MTDAKVETPEKGQRDRSPSFPFISLEIAIERLAEFEAHHKRGAITVDRIGPAWGMKAGTSQAQQTVAALKAYGLLESQRRPNGSEVSVSEEGRTYLRALQDSIKRQVLKRAALKPKQIEIYWREWGADRPKDAHCLDVLGLQGHFSKDGAEKFLQVYDATIAFAGLSESDKSEPDGGDEPKAADEPEGAVMQTATKMAHVSGTAPPMVSLPIGRPRIVMNGDRLDIQASVDLEGLEQLQTMLKKYAEILEMMAPKKD